MGARIFFLLGIRVSIISEKIPLKDASTEGETVGDMSHAVVEYLISGSSNIEKSPDLPGL